MTPWLFGTHPRSPYSTGSVIGNFKLAFSDVPAHYESFPLHYIFLPLKAPPSSAAATTYDDDDSSSTRARTSSHHLRSKIPGLSLLHTPYSSFLFSSSNTLNKDSE